MSIFEGRKLRKFDDDRGAEVSAGTGSANSSAVGFGDRFNDGEAKSGGAFAVGRSRRKTFEFAEQAILVGGDQTDALVLYFNTRSTRGRTLEGKGNGFVRGGIFYGVTDKILEELAKATRVDAGDDLAGGRDLAKKGEIFGAGEPVIVCDDVLDEHGEVGWIEAKIESAGFIFCVGEQVLDQVGNTASGFTDAIDEFAGRGVWREFVVEFLGEATDGVQGVPHVVGGDADEFGFEEGGFAQLDVGLFERPGLSGDSVELVEVLGAQRVDEPGDEPKNEREDPGHHDMSGDDDGVGLGERQGEDEGAAETADNEETGAGY